MCACVHCHYFPVEAKSAYLCIALLYSSSKLMVCMHIYVASGLVCLYLVHVLSVLTIGNVESIIVSCRLVGGCVCECVCLFMYNFVSVVLTCYFDQGMLCWWRLKSQKHTDQFGSVSAAPRFVHTPQSESYRTKKSGWPVTYSQDCGVVCYYSVNVFILGTLRG